MTDIQSALGRRAVEPPIGGDLGQWAANEVTKHEELCGLRYEGFAKEQLRINERIGSIEGKINGAIRWVMGIVATLAAALIIMFINNNHAQQQADESDKREMRARLSLLTQQLQNVGQRGGTLVLAPPGTQATTVTPATDNSTPLDPDDLGSATGAKPK